MVKNIGYTLHKRFTVKLALAYCKYTLKFVLLCVMYKNVKKLVK